MICIKKVVVIILLYLVIKEDFNSLNFDNYMKKLGWNEW